ncbi:hypothetical protein H4582DRAFT_515559 [Lactarius indigo]|nr:hypothetical protein H4582DRAFT_515559 [Lactarius indigo]
MVLSPPLRVRWYVVRYVLAYLVTRLANGDWSAVMCVRRSAENLATSRHALYAFRTKRKADIVDFIMQRRLDEIDLSSDDISERLIKLECGHIFTVETLDGHCKMSEYYESDAMGVFTATKAPPVNFQTPPSCPTCRGPITALRYGRVTKRATLDILEQNVASTMSSAIEAIGPEVEEFSRRLDSAKVEAKSIPFYPPILSAHRRARFGPESEPLPHEEISQASMTSVHGFSGEEGRAWNKVSL